MKAADSPTTEEPRDYLTLVECARQLAVCTDLIRQWCIRWRDGKPGGLPYSHAGVEPVEDTKRINYRIHVDDWAAFLASRRGQEDRQSPEPATIVVQPISYVGNRRRRVMRGR